MSGTAKSKYGAQSTTDEVLEGVDLTGKRVLVTGVSAGLGVETARALVAHGAAVVGAARDLSKARAATAGIAGSFELVDLDLASLASVRACADALLATGQPFDLIIANAGIMACPFARTSDGFESQFGVNHLGHFVLVNRVAPLLRPGGRFVSVASSGHHFADVDLDDPSFERTPYDELVAYGRAKTANILFAVEFDHRHKRRGVRATALHPGGIHTELGRYMTPQILERLTGPLEEQIAAGKTGFRWKTIPQGAATSVWAGVVANADEVGGRYCEDCHVAGLTEKNDAVGGGVRGYALDRQRAEALWAKSEEMAGESFAA
jgi:NAD(P)-dependent dehydrogenase (short-subunit alcohol dehydrogenase family)